ncbi:hypothetical protein ACJIZ3_005153 [Penstemon smallii]|uniref:Transmembrane protein n=1 Tax=Penstemon smallii TaxID=265156 RepID=A0ABD3S437_9LAMI
MTFTGVFNQTWWPVMTVDTTAPSYWLNGRFLLCAIWVLFAMIFASYLIWRYEGFNKSRKRTSEDDQKEEPGVVYDDEVWGTCSKSIHPIWLLAYRIVAFSALLSLILADAIVLTARVFFFYTQWTFTLVTVYFGLASLDSIYGCMSYNQERDDFVSTDSERGSYVAPTLQENVDTTTMTGSLNHSRRTAASARGYALQIMFQMCAGAVVLTDLVFWLILFPINRRLTFLVVCMHSVNTVFLLGDAILNRLRFPFFRIAYFALYTCVFVLFQWIIHACLSLRWPYPFLDLSSQFAPLWYLGVGLLLFPSFGIFTLVFWIKRRILSSQLS